MGSTVDGSRKTKKSMVCILGKWIFFYFYFLKDMPTIAKQSLCLFLFFFAVGRGGVNAATSGPKTENLN